MYIIEIVTPDVITFMSVIRTLIEHDLVGSDFLTNEFMKRFINFDEDSGQLVLTGIKQISTKIKDQPLLNGVVEALETNIPEIQYSIKETKE